MEVVNFMGVESASPNNPGKGCTGNHKINDKYHLKSG